MEPYIMIAVILGLYVVMLVIVKKQNKKIT
jgi:hypothetical protein